MQTAWAHFGSLILLLFPPSNSGLTGIVFDEMPSLGPYPFIAGWFGDGIPKRNNF
jgi:hypothetical protein